MIYNKLVLKVVLVLTGFMLLSVIGNSKFGEAAKTPQKKISDSLANGLMFYVPFDGTAKPFYALNPETPAGDFVFENGMVGKALSVSESNPMQFPSYPSESNFP